jgi:hypothetical protein
MKWQFALLILGMVPMFVTMGVVVSKLTAAVRGRDESVFVEPGSLRSEYSDFGGYSPKIFGGIGGIAWGVLVEIAAIGYLALAAVTTSIVGVDDFLAGSAIAVLLGVGIALHQARVIENSIRASEWYRWGKC